MEVVFTVPLFIYLPRRQVGGRVYCPFNNMFTQETGWMSNRGRQNVASFLIKDLGKNYFTPPPSRFGKSEGGDLSSLVFHSMNPYEFFEEDILRSRLKKRQKKVPSRPPPSMFHYYNTLTTRKL